MELYFTGDEMEETTVETLETEMPEQQTQKEDVPGQEEKEPEIDQAPADTEPGEILRQLHTIEQAIAELQETFQDKLVVDQHKNRLFDEMHRELNRYQNGMMDKILETMALDVIQLTDDVKKYVHLYERLEPTEENYRKLLRILKGLSQDLDDVLYRQSIEAYKVDGHEVDVRRQKIVQTVETNEEAKNNRIAYRMADGYEMNGKVIRPERIKIFKYVQPEAEDSSEKTV